MTKKSIWLFVKTEVFCRALDNIFVERLWRSLKYELIYLHDYQTVQEVEQAIHEYFSIFTISCSAPSIIEISNS